MRGSSAALVAVFALLGAGCGEDEQRQGDGQRAGPDSEVTIDEPVGTATGPAPELTDRPGRTGGEAQPGGAGDEEPARVQALLTGKDGRIGPRVVKVPPYISVRVELRSADTAGKYAVRVAGRVVRATPGRPGATTLAGLRPRQVLLVRPLARGRPIRIEANAQPGP